VLVGSNVILRCAGTDLLWEEYVSDLSDRPTPISHKADVARPNMYDLTTDSTGTYDLTIKSIQLNQGGKYRCLAFADSTSFAYVQVITFSGETLLFLT